MLLSCFKLRNTESELYAIKVDSKIFQMMFFCFNVSLQKILALKPGGLIPS